MTRSILFRGVGSSMIVVAESLLTGCTTVPSLQPTTDSIPVRLIVNRINCELHDAVVPWFKQYPVLKRDWIATINLNLIVNTQSGVTPNASIVEPLPQIVDKVKGTVSQSFAFGVGAGLSGQANRTDKLSYSIQLKEFADDDPKGRKGSRTMMGPPVCREGRDLWGGLDLKSWVDSAFSAEFSAFQVARIGEAVIALSEASRRLTEALARRSDPDDELIIAARSRLNALVALSENIKNLNDSEKVERVESLIPKDGNERKAVVDDIKAVVAAWATRQEIGDFEKALAKVGQVLDQQPEQGQGLGARHLISLTHEVTFVVAYNASLTPTWTLVNLRTAGGSTPGGSGSAGGGSPSSLLSASRSDNHDLLITLTNKNASLPPQNFADQITGALQRGQQ